MATRISATGEPDLIPPAALRPGVRIHDVNLIGEWNVGGEFWNVAPLLDELGLRVLCTLTGDARFRDIQGMHRAELNMVVCSKAMLSVARGMQERWGTPFFEGSFYGMADTSQALRDFAHHLGDSDLAVRTEALIAREEAAATAALAPYRQRLAGKRACRQRRGWACRCCAPDFRSTITSAAMRERGSATGGPARRCSILPMSCRCTAGRSPLTAHAFVSRRRRRGRKPALHPNGAMPC